MAGKVLTEEDFKKGEDPEDTSSKAIPVDQKFDGEGKPIKEEPKKEPEPSGKDKEEPQPEPSEESKYKHKTWEETEKARQELERGFTEKSMKLAEAERKIAHYEKPPEKPAVTIDEKIKEMTKKTLAEIRIIPADSTTHDEDAGYLWAKLHADIDDIKYEDRQRRSDTERQVVNKTYEKATKECIKTDAELRILGYEFSKTDPSLSTDDRIREAIDNTKGVLSQIREGLVEKQEKDKKDKEDLKVLGRGSSRTVKSEEEDKKPTTMSQQLAELNEKRKLKKDDIFR